MAHAGSGVGSREASITFLNQRPICASGPAVGSRGRGCFLSNFTGAGSIVTFLFITGFLPVTGGSAGEGCVFDSFALTAILSLCSWIDLSKINSMDVAWWGFSPEEELPIISRSVEPSADDFNFEWNSLCSICLIRSWLQEKCSRRYKLRRYIKRLTRR